MVEEQRSLNQWQLHFNSLYGENNGTHLPSLVDRIMWLGTSVKDLKVAVRQGSPSVAPDLARIFPRICGVAQIVNGLYIVDGMRIKYPLRGCVYCGESKCNCLNGHGDPTFSQLTDKSFQSDWNLNNWQSHIDRVYGERNRAIGVEAVLGHLFEEVFELAEVEHDDIRKNGLTTENKFQLQVELADCLAWTLAVSGLSDVDLEQAVQERYLRSCWKCGLNPCQCEEIPFKQLN